MLKGLRLFALALTLSTAQAVSALELKSGDVFADHDEIYRVLKEKAFNLADPRCVQTLFLQSKENQILVSMGDQLNRIDVVGSLDTTTGRTLLVIEGTYQLPNPLNQRIVKWGACEVLDPLKSLK